jgi:hypothetical protein
MGISGTAVEAGQHPSAFLNAGALSVLLFKDSVECIWLRLATAKPDNFIINRYFRD